MPQYFLKHNLRSHRHTQPSKPLVGRLYCRRHHPQPLPMCRGARGANGQKMFIAASSADAGEVAGEMSPSSSVGPIRHHRSPDPPAAMPLCRFEDFPVLPRTRQLMNSYLGVWQWQWGCGSPRLQIERPTTARGSVASTRPSTRPWSMTASRSATTARRLGSISPLAHVRSTSFRRSQGGELGYGAGGP